MKKIIFLFLLTIQPWVIAESNPTGKVILPKNGNFKFLDMEEITSKSPYVDAYLFEGKAKLRGLLKAGWTKNYKFTDKGHAIHALELHFYPEQTEVALLPSLVNGKFQRENERMIIFTNSSEESKKIVTQHFNNIPESFFKYQEGVLEQPASVTIENYKTFYDCEGRDYRAKLVSLETITKNKGKLVEGHFCPSYGGFLGDMVEDVYITQSKDGYVNLRAAPNTSAKVLHKIPNETYLEKIKTINNWFYVLFEGDYGYIHKSQVVSEDYQYYQKEQMTNEAKPQ